MMIAEADSMLKDRWFDSSPEPERVVPQKVVEEPEVGRKMIPRGLDSFKTL
jgi:hypothetical protein